MCLVHSQECIQEINKKLMLTLEFDYKIHAGIRGFLTLESLTLIKGLSDKSSYIRSVYSQWHVDVLTCTEQNVNNQTLTQLYIHFSFVLR